jgi:hypothetical protein
MTGGIYMRIPVNTVQENLTTLHELANSPLLNQSDNEYVRRIRTLIPIAKIAWDYVVDKKFKQQVDSSIIYSSMLVKILEDYFDEEKQIFYQKQDAANAEAELLEELKHRLEKEKVDANESKIIMNQMKDQELQMLVERAVFLDNMILELEKTLQELEVEKQEIINEFKESFNSEVKEKLQNINGMQQLLDANPDLIGNALDRALAHVLYRQAGLRESQTMISSHNSAMPSSGRPTMINSSAVPDISIEFTNEFVAGVEDYIKSSGITTEVQLIQSLREVIETQIPNVKHVMHSYGGKEVAGIAAKKSLDDTVRYRENCAQEISRLHQKDDISSKWLGLTSSSRVNQNRF